ncbi:MAG: hypothetical protein P8X74_10045 [Reinekea sp.]|jgi:hypothetical protein
MGLAGIGILMLIVVFVIYMRVVNRRFDGRFHPSQESLMLEKIEILESIGDDRAALKMARESLSDFPDSKELIEKIQFIEKRLGDGQ